MSFSLYPGSHNFLSKIQSKMTSGADLNPFSKSADFDTILATVGEFSTYQVALYILICLPASFPSAFSAFNQVFVAAIPPHWCRVPELENITLNSWIKQEISIPKIHELKPYEGWVSTFSKCRRYDVNLTHIIGEAMNSDQDLGGLNYSYDFRSTVTCKDGWDFDNSTYENTIVTQFNLYCDKAQLPVIATVVFYIGSFVGNLLFGYGADKYGRRPVFFLILLIQVVFGCISAFSVNIYMFMATRLLVGLTFPALYQIPFIIGMEFMGPPGRMFAGLVVSIFFGVAMCALGFVANAVRDWSTLTLLCNAPFSILGLYWFFLPESPRWLVIVGRHEEAAEILAKVAKVNKQKTDKQWLLDQCKRIGEETRTFEGQIERYGIADLFRTPNLRKKTIILTFVWLVNATVYNGLTYNVSNLGVNDYFAFAINGAVELPAYFLAWPLLDRVGRRWLLSIFMLLGGLSCMLALCVPPNENWWISGFAFTGKFCNSASFAILYIFAGELYPTVIRALGMGFSSMIAGMGLIMAPYLVYLAIYSRILPLLIMGVLTLAAGLASTFLPETLGTHLPQTVDDAEQFGKNTRFFSWRPKPVLPLIRPDPDGNELEPMDSDLSGATGSGGTPTISKQELVEETECLMDSNK